MQNDKNLLDEEPATNPQQTTYAQDTYTNEEGERMLLLLQANPNAHIKEVYPVVPKLSTINTPPYEGEALSQLLQDPQYVPLVYKMQAGPYANKWLVAVVKPTYALTDREIITAANITGNIESYGVGLGDRLEANAKFLSLHLVAASQPVLNSVVLQSAALPLYQLMDNSPFDFSFFSAQLTKKKVSG